MTMSTQRRTARRPLRPLVTMFGAGALVAGLAVPASAATGGAPAAVGASRATSRPATSCPSAPPKPATSSSYELDGQRWNPADPIDWTYDTDHIGATAKPKRLADIKKALADAAKETNLDFVYKGEVKSVDTKPKYFSLQFVYVTSFSGAEKGSLGDQTNEYIQGKVKQTVIGEVNLLASLSTGFGGYDTGVPTKSAEGDVLLHELGAVLGLDNVAASLPEVMSSTATAAHYYGAYQPGDEYGLWKVGAASGCGGFSE